MQEQMNAALKSVSEFAVPGDVPSFADVRDKIEARYARALGEAELASSSVGVRLLEVQKASMDAEGAQRLEQIRQSLEKPKAQALQESSEKEAEPAG
jgi:phage shock protein A